MSSSAAQLVNALSPQVGNEALISSFLAQVESFNSEARLVFFIMLEGRKNQARERITALERYHYVQ